jgi:hypothetical protein
VEEICLLGSRDVGLRREEGQKRGFPDQRRKPIGIFGEVGE